MFENETWHEIAEFPHYHVSDYGRIKHVNRDLVRKITVNERGFPVVLLSSAHSPSRYLRQVNKLVAEAFLPPPQYSSDTSVWHIDGDLLNCRASNLRWEMRSRVLEWNEMHRRLKPAFNTPRVKNNRTGDIYANAYECAMTEGMIESAIIYKIERQARHVEDDNARYRYIFE
jgi:hypothetical protein